MDAAEICLILEKSEHFTELYIKNGEFELRVTRGQSQASSQQISQSKEALIIPDLPENFDEPVRISEELTKAMLADVAESNLLTSNPSDFEEMQIAKHLEEQRLSDAKA